MSDWEQATLGDLIEIKHGFAFKGEFITDVETPNLLLTPGNFAIGGGFQFKKRKYYSGKIPAEYILSAGDLIVSMTDLSKEADTLGYSAVVPEAEHVMLHNQRLGKVSVKSNKTTPDFIHWLLRTADYRNEILSNYSGSTVKHTSPTKILAYEFSLPSLAEQREIAAILGALDDKIEVNRKTAETLEEMARALYRSWFVDFDPVHAKAAGRAPAHMDTATAALFPDSFSEDGLPEGWEWGTLSDLIDFNPREKLQKGTLAPYLDMKALPTAGMSADTPYDRAFTSGTKFRARDTLLARITPCLENGKTAMVDDIGGAEVGWGSTEFIVMRAKDGVPPSLPYCVARDSSFREDAIASMTGSSGRQRADAKTIAAVDSAVPVEEIVVAFGEATMPMVEKIHQLGRENQTLAPLRDTLLPRLMSGELRVGEAKKQVEAVA